MGNGILTIQNEENALHSIRLKQKKKHASIFWIGSSILFISDIISDFAVFRRKYSLTERLFMKRT